MNKNVDILKDVMRDTMNIQRLNWAFQEQLLESCYYRHVIRDAIKYIKDKTGNGTIELRSSEIEQLLDILKGSDNND